MILCYIYGIWLYIFFMGMVRYQVSSISINIVNNIEIAAGRSVRGPICTANPEAGLLNPWNVEATHQPSGATLTNDPPSIRSIFQS